MHRESLWALFPFQLWSPSLLYTIPSSQLFQFKSKMPSAHYFLPNMLLFALFEKCRSSMLWVRTASPSASTEGERFKHPVCKAKYPQHSSQQWYSKSHAIFWAFVPQRLGELFFKHGKNPIFYMAWAIRQLMIIQTSWVALGSSELQEKRGRGCVPGKDIPKAMPCRNSGYLLLSTFPMSIKKATYFPPRRKNKKLSNWPLVESVTGEKYSNRALLPPLFTPTSKWATVTSFMQYHILLSQPVNQIKRCTCWLMMYELKHI